MIQSDKAKNALYALNGVLITARAMAYDEVSYAKIADVLDQAEYLPRLLADEADRTADFRKFLADLATKHPQFAFVLERFDAPVPATW